MRNTDEPAPMFFGFLALLSLEQVLRLVVAAL